MKHKDAGVDIVIAQGGEGGGHTGDVGSIVLWPQVAKAIAPTTMLAAGGIGSGEQIAAALALGAQGVWAGSLWITVEAAGKARPRRKALPVLVAQVVEGGPGGQGDWGRGRRGTKCVSACGSGWCT